MLETAHQTPDTAADSYEAAIDDAIATCNSDMRGALRALLIANEVLETELAKLRHLQHVARVPACGAAIGVDRHCWKPLTQKAKF